MIIGLGLFRHLTFWQETFRHGHFITVFFWAWVLFSSADIPANENYVSKDIPALGYYSTGTFLHRYISVQCQNVLVLKLPYCCAWCRNILVLKCTHALMSRDEKSPCQKVPVPKYPCAEKSMWRKIPERKSPLAKMSMETKCLYVHSPICQNVLLTKR